MFVKQIDEKTALQLAAKGKEVLVAIPSSPDPAERSLADAVPADKEQLLLQEIRLLTVGSIVC